MTAQARRIEPPPDRVQADTELRVPSGDEHVPAGHVCIFTTAHPTDDVRVNSKISNSLLNAGYSVTWVGPAVSYFDSSMETDSRIHYRLIPPTKGRLDRLAAGRRISRAARFLPPVDWWYSPDPDAARAAVKMARRHGGRVIFDIHEVYHGALMDRWLYGRQLQPLRDVVRRGIARTAARSDLVIGVSSAVLAPYSALNVDTLVVRNCAPEWFSNVAKTNEPANSPMVVFHGKVISGNGTPVVLDALEIMPRISGVRVIMFDVSNQPGSYAASVRDRTSRQVGDRSVAIISGVPHHEMPALLASADVGMIAYGRGLGEDSLPNRLFEYMAAGLAVLAPAYSTEICSILEEEGIGITADFDDPGDVARALSWLRDHPQERAEMGDRARIAFVKRHSWTQEFTKLAAAMQR